MAHRRDATQQPSQEFSSKFRRSVALSVCPALTRAIFHLSHEAPGKGVDTAIPLAVSRFIRQQSVRRQLIRQCCRAPPERLIGPSLVQVHMVWAEEGGRA